MPSSNGDTFATLDPGTGEKLADVHALQPAEVDRAVELAGQAFENADWAQLPVNERCVYLQRLADEVEKRKPFIAQLESLDCGKILGQAGVSLVMLVMYGGAGMAALFAFAMLDLVPMMHLLYLALYFIMAYFMIATIMTAIGSAVTELRDAQSLMGPAMLLLII